MPEDPLKQLNSELLPELLRSGMASRHARRMVSELADHLEDLAAEARSRGMSHEAAARHASERLGDCAAIVQGTRDYPELRTWIYRYPRLARLYFPLAYVLLLPAAPVFAGIANPGVVFRWMIALMLSAGVTAGMMLFMQLAIVAT